MITTAIDIAGLDGKRVAVTPEQLEELDTRIKGALLHPGDPGWDEAVQLWNGMVAKEPALVVQPASARDVVAAVRFARDHRLLLSIKGGGHNIAGTGIAEGGLALDMSHLREVTVDPEARLAQVGAGCRLEEVEIVTADGALRTASRREHADLFWAIRGGGGNFGAVTRFTFRLHSVGPMVFGGLIAWPFERADEVLRTYRALTAEASRDLAVWHVLLHAPPAPFVPQAWHGQKVCAMAVCYSGDLDRVDEVLAPIRSLGNPIVDRLQEQPYVQIQSYLDGTEPKGMHYYWKTEFVAELSDALLDVVRDLFAECPIPHVQLGFLHIGGALNERRWDDGAVGNRDVRYAIGVNGRWEPDVPEADRYRQWIRDAWQRIRPLTMGRTYTNFQTADEDEARIHATYGANLDRLAHLKAKYDPDNLFRVNRNIRAERAR